MENLTIIKSHYKRVLNEAKQLTPDLKESYSILFYINLQNQVIGQTDFDHDKERVIKAIQNKSWALELFNVFEDRKN